MKDIGTFWERKSADRRTRNLGKKGKILMCSNAGRTVLGVGTVMRSRTCKEEKKDTDH